MATPTSTTIDELIEEFQDLDEIEACQYLDELGRELPEIPDEVRVDSTLVPGCQSRVWLVVDVTDDATPVLRITADSDALVVKGLVFVVLTMFDGQTPESVMELDYAAVFDRLGIGRMVLPQRKNGLFSMVRRIRNSAGAAIGVAVDDEPASASAPSVPLPPRRSIENIRDEFPILTRPLPDGQRVVYLDSGSSAQKPGVVIEKEREVEENYFANAFRGRYYFGARVDDEIEAVRERVRRLIRAESTSEIVFTAGTTMSLNLVAHGWAMRHIKAGDEIVVNEMEHHANLVPWQMVAAQTGAKLRYLPLTSDGRVDVSGLEETITSQTALVAVTGMSNVLGTINPVKEIAARAAACDARIVVDAAQSVPHARVDVVAEGIDFLAFSGHKAYGPTGVGVLYGRMELLREMDPLFGGGHMIQHVGQEQSTWADPPARFEAGTMPIVQIIGLGAAIDFIDSLGYEAIHDHETALVRYAHERLGQIPGLVIYGPALEHKGAIVSFSVEGVSAEDLSRRLDQRGIFTRHGHHCTMPLHHWLGVPATTRASFAVYNTTEDVDRLAEAIEAACGELR